MNVSKLFLALSFVLGAFGASEARAEMFGTVPAQGIRAPGPSLIGCPGGNCGGQVRTYTRVVQGRVVIPVQSYGTHGYGGAYAQPYPYYGQRPFYAGRGCGRCAKRCHNRCASRCGHCRRGVRGGFSLRIQTPRFGFGLAIF